MIQRLLGLFDRIGNLDFRVLFLDDQQFLMNAPKGFRLQGRDGLFLRNSNSFIAILLVELAALLVISGVREVLNRRADLRQRWGRAV